jgi:predicted nucleic acid-binding protein
MLKTLELLKHKLFVSYEVLDFKQGEEYLKTLCLDVTLPGDSLHLALSLKHGIKAIATTNPDFMSTSALVDLYTCNPKLLKRAQTPI